VERLEEQMRLLFNIPFAAKFGGAGNYNACVAYPHRLEKIWEPLLKETWGYTLFPDHTNRTLRSLCSIFDALKRINTIIIDLDRDIWTYVSMEYFKQSVGSGGWEGCGILNTFLLNCHCQDCNV
jgi:adenylosuccinate lyase